jgi:SAM-dependent methyltransferase
MYTRLIQTAIAVNYRMILMRQHEWWCDYPWFIKHLEGHRVLDLGFSAHSFFTLILCEYGFDVTGVDFTEPNVPEWNSPGASFVHVSADVRRLPLQDGGYSTIVAPSLLEHVGLGFYGDAAEPDAVESALGEWRRVLRPGGLLLVQLPYGAQSRIVEFQGRPYYRIYTGELIRRHFAAFEIEDVRFDALEPHGWIEVSKSVADHIDHRRPFPPCTVKLAAREKGDRRT